jgi:hypothetical protein
MDTQAIAEKVENILNETELPEGALLYGVSLGKEEDETPSVCLIKVHPDIYELLESKDALVAKMFDYAVVVTTGWAAPLAPNGEVTSAPSEHAQRRRVRLTICANRENVVNILRFPDTDEVVTDPGQAEGSLAIAVKQFVS